MAEKVLEHKNMSADEPSKKTAKKNKKPGKKGKVKKIILLVSILALIAAGIFFAMKLFQPADDSQIMTDFVSYGAITSTVTGDGFTKAKESATLTLTTSGTVSEVLVNVGDTVTAGTELYKIKSEAAEAAVKEAQQNVDNCQKELNSLYDAQKNLTINAEFSGKLIEVMDLNTNSSVNAGDVVAKLIDDSKMRLKQYYSYAYENDIKKGSTVTVSIPSSMAQLTGTVEAVYKVSRISAEGSKLFEADIVINNPGTLTAGVEASASMTAASGETIYPYEAATLEYNRSMDIAAKVGGPVKKVNLRNYAEVKAGTNLVQIGGEDNASMIATAENQLKAANDSLKEAQDTMALLNGVAPIDGTVLSLDIAPGDEVTSGKEILSIANTSSILVEASVDERNISYIEKGMMVDLDQWGTLYTGTVESISMTGNVENGVSTFPVIISVDNVDGTLMPGSSMTYTLIASQNDNCLILPIQCVKYIETEYGTDTVVFVKSDSRPDNAIDIDTPVEGVPEKGYWPVPVVIGISDTYNVEIVEGVNEGDEVFTQVYKEEAWY